LREAAHQRWAKGWDDEEFYWAADEALEASGSAGLHGSYVPVSACGGVFVFTG
jgi:hypothetical protein